MDVSCEPVQPKAVLRRRAVRTPCPSSIPSTRRMYSLLALEIGTSHSILSMLLISNASRAGIARPHICGMYYYRCPVETGPDVIPFLGPWFPPAPLEGHEQTIEYSVALAPFIFNPQSLCRYNGHKTSAPTRVSADTAPNTQPQALSQSGYFVVAPRPASQTLHIHSRSPHVRLHSRSFLNQHASWPPTTPGHDHPRLGRARPPSTILFV